MLKQILVKLALSATMSIKVKHYIRSPTCWTFSSHILSRMNHSRGSWKEYSAWCLCSMSIYSALQRFWNHERYVKRKKKTRVRGCSFSAIWWWKNSDISIPFEDSSSTVKAGLYMLELESWSVVNWRPHGIEARPLKMSITTSAIIDLRSIPRLEYTLVILTLSVIRLNTMSPCQCHNPKVWVDLRFER